MEANVDGRYRDIAVGTTIGYKRVLRFDDITASKLRITFETDAPCLTLCSVGVYNAPVLVDDPVPAYDIKGNLSFSTEDGISAFYALSDNPKASDFVEYTQPVQLPMGGKLHYFARDKNNGFETDVITEELGIAKNNWKVVSLDGSPAGEGVKAIDGNPETILSSSDNSPGHPHQLIIDLNENISIDAFSYLSRQDGSKEGIIYEYEFYASTDGENWGNPVSEGAFNNIENNPVRQYIKLEDRVLARYIKLVSKSAIRQGAGASFAEIDVFAEK